MPGLSRGLSRGTCLIGVADLARDDTKGKCTENLKVNSMHDECNYTGNVSWRAHACRVMPIGVG